MSKRKAKQKQDAVYEIEIQGLYHSSSGDRHVTKPYSVTVKMLGKHVDSGALSVFKNDIAPTLMPQKYPDYTGLYTYEVKSHSVPDAPELEGQNIALLNRQELLSYIEEEELPIKQELFSQDNDQLRQAVLDCEADEPTFLKHQETLKSLGRGVFRSELADLNPEVRVEFTAEPFAVVDETPKEAEDKDKDRTTVASASRGRGKSSSVADNI